MSIFKKNGLRVINQQKIQTYNKNSDELKFREIHDFEGLIDFIRENIIEERTRNDIIHELLRNKEQLKIVGSGYLITDNTDFHSIRYNNREIIVEYKSCGCEYYIEQRKTSNNSTVFRKREVTQYQTFDDSVSESKKTLELHTDRNGVVTFEERTEEELSFKHINGTIAFDEYTNKYGKHQHYFLENGIILNHEISRSLTSESIELELYGICFGGVYKDNYTLYDFKEISRENFSRLLRGEQIPKEELLETKTNKR